MFTYVNGQVIPNSEVRISPFDHGFLYGVGVFETFRTYDGAPFLLDEHLNRLNRSLQELHIDLHVVREEVLDILAQLEEANGWRDAYIRFNVSAGEGDIGLQTAPYQKPNVIVFQKKVASAGPMTEKRGVWLQTRRNRPEGESRLKSHHYLNNIFGKREAGSDPSIEGIFLTEDGFVAEGVVSNMFWIKKGTLYTPALQTGILGGVTRRFVMDIARDTGLRVEEGLYTPAEAEAADEVFVTNSIQEIVPLRALGEKAFPGAAGEAVQLLFKQYRRAVRQ
ncbi:aminodeoxychorismate lyase [Domibacillus sp. PGB-M46]|uniref:aminodeoxychorismate lyase n=1 Tax=Domibacillus sp. PGB-M46 TaxID=2910255 RepID=UPI001F579F01|nr:aminodeoxychorismate lyase [Domibacillus sp. PGB-M46]MCI2254939.1 aminodeoxychorismate lyase [Domibacillus sp. PGB-M46]